MATKKTPGGKIGRPKAQVALRSLTINFDPDLLAAIERARVRREKTVPGIEVTMSAAVRALLLKAIAAEEPSEPVNPAPESSTKK